MLMPMQNRLAGELPVKDRQEVLRCVFNIMILYDELAAGQRAMELFTCLADEHADQIEFQPQIWRFDLVSDPDWRPFLDHEAMSADLFIISTTSPDDLPAGVRTWLSLCLPAKRGAGAAVVAMLGQDGAMDLPSSPRLTFLKNLAEEAGLEFFTPISRANPHRRSITRITPVWSEATEPSVRRITTLSSERSQLPRAMPPFNKIAPNWYWGINE